ncbi:2-methylaconitate cis-trans isomerase PrpF family protein [Glutamicibacter arilaitensis]|uniref:2-methylaconitate cis-trans isomerase PrpF family protein n=1 Tax=Glutamicibacter arilaitensis TaxID=256701 RepID=UPI00384B447E
MQIPSVLMRGGTSKGLFFHEKDLPQDIAQRDAFLLAAMGSPDPYRRQIDGLGGAVSTTSKIAIIGDGAAYGVDVTYEFGQVSLDQPLVDRKSNCGNISSAVGPFAVDEGLVEVTEPFTVVKFLNLNTNKVIAAHVPTKNGRFDPIGDFELPGVPGFASKIQLDFVSPGGAVTGKLLPTGSVRDELDVPGVGTIPVSIVDATNPLVFVRWEDLGLTGLELPAQIDADPELLARIEAVRAQASVLAGITDSVKQATRDAPSVPKLSLVGAPRDYTATNGKMIPAEATSLRAMMMSMGRAHNSYPLTGAFATSVAANLPGTLVHDLIQKGSDEFVIGHPAGLLTVTADVEFDGHESRVNSVSGFRTARRLMKGQVFVPDEMIANQLAD